MELQPLQLEPGGDWTVFYQVAQAVYAGDPIWVPETAVGMIERAAAGRKSLSAVVALDQGKPVGRAVWLPDRQTKIGSIAFFEALLPAAGRAVLHYCEQRLAAAGMRSILAPKWDNLAAGLLLKGFDQPQTVLTNYNPPYYVDIFLNSGFSVKQTMISYLFQRSSSRFFLRRPVPNIRTRPLNLNQLEREIGHFHRLQQVIFTGTRDYQPRTLAEDRALVESFLPFLDPELLLFAETVSGDVVGLIICLPDLYQKLQGRPIDRARIISIGALPGHQHKGVGAALVFDLVERLLAKGYEEAEASLIAADNRRPQNLAKRFFGRRGREFALLEKSL